MSDTTRHELRLRVQQDGSEFVQLVCIPCAVTLEEGPRHNGGDWDWHLEDIMKHALRHNFPGIPE